MVDGANLLGSAFKLQCEVKDDLEKQLDYGSDRSSCRRVTSYSDPDHKERRSIVQFFLLWFAFEGEIEPTDRHTPKNFSEVLVK